MSATPGGRDACAAPASKVLEGYSPTSDGLVRGALEATAYACDEHAPAARREWMPGLTVFDCIADSAEGHVCGEVKPSQ